ncbi:copper resistance protein CopC [Tomitella fengzijianii]|uniref:Copper resistance protein CopC n=2 Tax=Tomitella fengzijianii TaxID=2597660 RepID=A0A516X791_9ACTN|nr:copper resistance CopC family protein [Tomitella fengzijianii]QDQ98935.1 copper resistance protein CopC [Tomitella fengzijianii]
MLAAVFAALLAATGTVAGVGVASAHSAIVEMSPPDGAALDAGPDTVTLTFNEAISPNYANLTVVGPDGHLWSRGEPTVDGNTISVPVGELGPAGTYTVAVKVTSADGHAVGYTRSFELTQPGDGTPGPKADASDADEDSDSGGGVQWWWFVIPAVVLFGGGLWFALRSHGDD